MLRLALVVVAVLEVGFPLLLYFLRDRLIFFPAAEPAAWQGLPSIGEGVAASLVEVVRPDGRRLAAYDVRPGTGAAPGAAVLFLHGNAGNIAGRASTLGAFVRGTGTRTLMIDYSGYGGNEGSPSEEEAVADGLAGFDHLVAGGVPPDRIVIHGVSIGGAVALAVAAKRNPAGLVTQSAPSSLSSMALRIYPWLPLTALLVRGSFRGTDRIREYRGPVLLVHGNLDRTVPYGEALALKEAAGDRAELLTIEGGDHNDVFGTGGEEYLKGLGERHRRWTAPR